MVTPAISEIQDESTLGNDNIVTAGLSDDVNDVRLHDLAEQKW